MCLRTNWSVRRAAALHSTTLQLRNALISSIKFSWVASTNALSLVLSMRPIHFWVYKPAYGDVGSQSKNISNTATWPSFHRETYSVDDLGILLRYAYPQQLGQQLLTRI
jgi:hypothetical protein